VFYRTGIGRKRRLGLRTPACNLRSLAASLARVKEGNWRGEGGLFIGAGRDRNGQASIRIEERVKASSGGYWRENRTGEEDD
jgi:hypothetical protein